MRDIAVFIESTKKGPNRALMLEGFQAVCSHGNMEVVDWIASWCQLTTSEVRSNANAALRNACRNGHLDLVKWMIDRFALDASDARQGSFCDFFAGAS